MNGKDLRYAVALGSLLAIHAWPADAAAQQRPPVPAPEQTVTVSATGTVTRAPDRAVVMLAVESSAATAHEAAESNAERMQRLQAALRRLRLGDDAIETTSYQLHPEYDYRQDGPRRTPEQRIIGYRAINMVRVTIDEIDRVGAVIDAAVQAGANRVHGINFMLRDPEEARHDALRAAVANARGEAEALAAALGRQLGPALSVTTAGSYVPTMYSARADMAAPAMAVPTPIEPGTLDIVANVTVVFRLDPRK